MNRLGLLVAVAVVLGCAGASEFRALPKPEQDAFLKSCYSPIRGRSCTGAYADSCMGDMLASYAKLPDTSTRRAFLVEAGCPASLVSTVLPAK